jgi:hypothetical protein
MTPFSFHGIPNVLISYWKHKMPRSFISHASSDREVVETHIVTTLKINDIETWYCKEDISGAQEWERAILAGLNDCDWFLLALSPRSLTSDWVKDEVHWAMSHRLGRIVPVLLADCDPLGLHIRLPRIQHVDFRSPGIEAQRRLLEAFRGPGASELLANLDIMVLRPEGRFWLTQCLPGNGALPVRPDDLIRIEVSLNQPAYVYLFWIDGSKQISPIYPWQGGRWERRPEHEQPVQRLELPEGDPSLGWPIQSARSGLETVLLMVREEPLPRGVNLQWLTPYLPAEEQVIDPSLYFMLDSRKPVQERGIDLENPRHVDQVQLRLHEELLHRFGRQCRLILASTFSSSG